MWGVASTRRRFAVSLVVGVVLAVVGVHGPSDLRAKEHDVADLPPEWAAYVVELAVKAVRESDGRAVPRIELVVEGGNEVFGSWHKQITTDATGRARLRLPYGDYRVYPLAEAFALVWSGQIDLRANQEVTVRLRQACTLVGRVVDDRGKPLAGSRVEVWADAGVLDLVADRNGRFEVARLTVGEHPVTAHVPGFAPRTETGTARPGRAGREVFVVLHRGATLTVTALCGSAPCVGARVKVSAPEDGGELDVEADGAAAFRDLPAGLATIMAVRSEGLPGEAASPKVERLLRPGDVAAVEVVLVPTGGSASIKGVAVDRAGKPLYAGIEVDCGAVYRRLVTDGKDGSFLARDLPAGRCKVTAVKDGLRGVVESDGSAPVRLVVDQPER